MTTRFPTVTEKIPRQVTGLAGSLFVHVLFEPNGRVHEIRYSEKGKEDSTLDKILTALGETTTAIIKDAQNDTDSIKARAP